MFDAILELSGQSVRRLRNDSQENASFLGSHQNEGFAPIPHNCTFHCTFNVIFDD